MKYVFSVPDMSCGHCQARIESTLKGTGRVNFIVTDLEKKTVSLESDLSEQELEVLFDEAGYDAVKSE